MESGLPRAGRQRERDGKQVQPRPTKTPRVAAKPEKNQAPDAKILVQLKQPGDFPLGQVLRINGLEHGLELDIAVNATVQDMPNLLSQLERDEYITDLCIDNFLPNRPGQPVVDALLNAAVNNAIIQEVSLLDCCIGFDILGSVVGNKSCVSLINCRSDADLSVPEKRDELVRYWESNNSLQKVQIHQTFDTDFLGALFPCLSKLSNLSCIDIAITNATSADSLQKFLLDAPKRKMEIILDECRFDETAVNRFLEGLRKTTLDVNVVLQSCCWKPRPETTKNEVRKLYNIFKAGVIMTRAKLQISPKADAALKEDLAGQASIHHIHADIPTFPDELERGHSNNSTAVVALQDTKPPAVTDATARKTRTSPRTRNKGHKK